MRRFFAVTETATAIFFAADDAISNSTINQFNLQCD